MRYALLAMTVWAAPCMAQDWALRDGDTALSAPEMAERIVGHTLVFYDNGQSRFSPGGSYSYTYDGGRTAFGTFSVQPDSVICIAYRNGWSRCDKYVLNSARLVLLTEDGERFPIRP